MGFLPCTSGALEWIYFAQKLPYLITMNPKGGELFLSTVKSEEIQMEAGTHSNAQIDVKTWVKRRKTHRAAW